MDISAISKSTAEHYIWGNRCDGWHLVKNPQLSVIQERMPADTAEVRHLHHHAQQFFYVLAGKAVMEMDGSPMVLTAGDGIWIPAGASHQMRNDSGDEVHFLVISQPPSHGDRENAQVPQFYKSIKKMSHEIAYEFINQEISLLRRQSYADLVAKIGKAKHQEFLAHDGSRYLLETEVFQDSKKGGDIRVMVCADGGGVSAVFPVSDAFVMADDGTIVG